MDAGALAAIRERRNALRAAQGCSLFLAGLTAVTEVSTAGSKPLLPLALAWNSRTAQLQSWISLTSAAHVAHLLSEAWYTATRQTDNARRVAKLSGELMAVWKCDAYSVDAQNAARTAIATALRSYILNNPNRVLNAVRAAARVVGNGATFQGQTVPNVYVPTAQDGELINAQRHVFFSTYGPAMPSNLLATPEWIAVWRNWTQNADVNVVFNTPEVDPVLAQDYVQQITGMDDETVMGVIEFLARADPQENRRYALAAAFVGIAALCKGGNVTDAWVESRLARLHNRVPDLDITALVTQEVIRQYEVLYPRTDMTLDQQYLTLITSYYAVDAQNHNSLAWIIEQATAANITPLLALAYVCAKSPLLNWDIPLSNQSLCGELAQLATMIMHVADNPFCSLARPPIHVREYADWAYIGIALRQRVAGDPQFRAYQNNVSQMTRMTRRSLDKIVDDMVTRADLAEQAELTLAHHLSVALNANIQQHGNHLYITPNDGALAIDVRGMEGQLDRPTRVGAGDQAVYDVAAAAPLEDDEQREDDALHGRARIRHMREMAAQARATWARNTRNLPSHSYRVSLENAEYYMSTQRTPMARDLMLCLNQVDMVASQRELAKPTIVAGDGGARFLNIPPARVVIPQAIRDALVRLGVEARLIPVVPPEPTRQPLTENDGELRRTVNTHASNALPPQANPGLPQQQDVQVPPAFGMHPPGMPAGGPVLQPGGPGVMHGGNVDHDDDDDLPGEEGED
uniref:Nucleocapsid protein n=1 Tax=Periplaneta americana aliusvus 1 TaxID=3133547 RepID=A0AAT9J9W6_9VIRU